MLRASAILLILFVAKVTDAQTSKPIKDFNIVSASGTEKKLEDFMSYKALVIMIDDPECAYSEYYLDRFKVLQNEFADQKVAFIKVTPSNINPVGQNTYQDKNGTLLKQLGAKKITEVFLIDLLNENKVVYSGAFDDNPQLSSGVDEPYLKNAINKLLSGNKILKSGNRPVGCTIKEF